VLGEHLGQLPRERASAYRPVDDRLVLSALSRLRLADVEELTVDAGGRRAGLAALVAELKRDLPALSDALSGSYLNHATISRQLASQIGVGADAGVGTATAAAAEKGPAR
jgi:hypothetical protein